MISVVHECCSYSAQTWQCARLPAVLMSPDRGIGFFSWGLPNFPCKYCLLERNGKFVFIKKTRKTYSLPFLGFQMDMVESKFLAHFPSKSESGHLDFHLKCKGRDGLYVTPYTRQLPCGLRALPWVNYTEEDTRASMTELWPITSRSDHSSPVSVYAPGPQH